jgi:hypothetical protein
MEQFLDRGFDPDLVEPNLQAALDADEVVRVRALAAEAVLAVTPRRVVVADTRQVNLAIPFEGIRRIQFDIERTRPATLVIVPELAREHPQVLAIPPQQYRAVADALVAIGTALAPIDPAAQAQNEAPGG